MPLLSEVPVLKNVSFQPLLMIQILFLTTSVRDLRSSLNLLDAVVAH